MPKKGLTMYYNIVENNDNEVEIHIYGDITSWPWLDSDVSSYRLANKLAQIPEDKHITVRINSYGGEVAEGLTIYNVLKNRNVTTVCDGFAASAASIIFCAGKSRVMNKSSLLFIHNAIGVYRGNSDDLEKGAEDLKKMNEVIRNAYIEAGVTASEEELIEMMNKEEWILPADAIKYGFATEIADDSDESYDTTVQNILPSIQNSLVNIETVEVEEDIPLQELINKVVEQTVTSVLNKLNQKSDINESKNPPYKEEILTNNIETKKGFLGFNKK